MIRREDTACELKQEVANFFHPISSTELNDFKSRIPQNKKMTFRLAHFTENVTYAVQT